MLMVKAVTAKQYSSKIVKVSLFCCDIQYCITKFGFLIFEFEYSAFDYFIHAEVDILNSFLNFKEKKSFNYCFSKKVNPGVTYEQQFTEV